MPSRAARPPREKRPQDEPEVNPIYTDPNLKDLPRIPVYGKGGPTGKEIAVSPEDHEHLSDYKWYESTPKRGVPYFFSYEKKAEGHRGRAPMILLHRVVAERAGLQGDRFAYRDFNNQNSTRENIIPVTRQQSLLRAKVQSNKLYSKFKGVIKTPAGTFTAHIYQNRKAFYLGTYPTDVTAAAAYNGAAYVMYGDTARLNAIEGGPTEEDRINIEEALHLHLKSLVQQGNWDDAESVLETARKVVAPINWTQMGFDELEQQIKQ